MAVPPEAQVRPGIGAAVAAAERRARRSLLRNHGGGHAPVSNLELFFDLVYVFAITQVSHFIGHHPGLTGFAEGVLLFLALWWAWMYTTWSANWANPDRLPVRLLLLALMLLSLMMAVAIPRAFADEALVFAGCYLALQIGRSAAMTAIFRNEGAANTRNMLRITLWFMASAPLWLGGAWLGGTAQIICWTAALGIEYLGPFALFRVPGLGRSNAADWDISGSHMAERCALFIIIALGEGIVVTGASFIDLSMEAGRVAAFMLAFVSSALMWWLYFDIGMERGARHIAGHAEPGRVARGAYTYIHMPIVLGIVIAAVGDAMLLREWDRPADPVFTLMLGGGTALFLTGLGLFKRFANTFGNFPVSHLIALALLGGLAAAGFADALTKLGFAAGAAAILLVTAVWEWVSYHGGWMERMEARGWKSARWVRERLDRRALNRRESP